MPVYEYVCKRCSHPFEELIFPGDPAPTCPVCASADAERVLSAFAVGHGAAPAPACATGGGGGGGGGCGGCGNAGACGWN
jgi:putative FmdB family regulatory protein